LKILQQSDKNVKTFAHKQKNNFFITLSNNVDFDKIMRQQ